MKVSPAWIIYVPVEGAGVGAGVGTGTLLVLDGIDICCPIWRPVGLTSGFAASSAATDIPNFVAIEKKVSPALIV